MSAINHVTMPMPEGEPLTLALHPSEYPPEVVLSTLATFAETGNTSAAGQANNVPQATAYDWITNSNNQPLLAQLRTAIRFNHAHTINRAIGMSLANTLERLEHGDMVVTRQGTLRAVPMSGKDCAVVASMMIDKYQLLISGINEDQASTRLETIAARLEEATSKLNAKGSNRPANVLDVTPEGATPPPPVE